MNRNNRVYYVGDGEEFEASEDGGQTWETFTKCKLVEYGGRSYVWPPPGKSWEWKQLSIKVPFHDVNMKNYGMTVRHGRSLPVVVGDGPEESYLDLDKRELRVAMRTANAQGLVREKDYDPAKYRTAEQLLAHAERLRQAAESQMAKVVDGEPAKPQRKRATRKSAQT